MCLGIAASVPLSLSAPQLEAGRNVTPYQATDEALSYTDDYGAWFNKGGIGGTIQNPLLRLNEDGSIVSRDGSFVIIRTGRAISPRDGSSGARIPSNCAM